MIGTAPIGVAPIGGLDTAFVETRLTIPATTVYRCFLGSTLLPITSIQLRLRQSTPSYVSVVVPNAPAYANEIADNIDETLTVEHGFLYADGTEVYEELAHCTISRMSDQRGATSRSITLSGYGDNASDLAVEVPLEGLQYYNLSNGIARIRALPEPRLKAGDIGIVGGYSVTANLISTFIGIGASGSVTGFSEISDG